MTPFVAIVVGSRSDLPALEELPRTLDGLGIGHELRVISAHRAPALLERYIAEAEGRGVAVFIAAAGLAAHLPGVIASRTTRPVIGLPLKGGLMDGLDALLSIVQMPKGVPVATVGVGNATNAALLAAEMLALGDEDLAGRLSAFRARQAEAVANDETNLGAQAIVGR
ncbi:MAG: 5-(carboxyamino)imidazole ribonucleotide mutase [Candidatus Limnocylindrales bacterium]